MNVNPTAWLRSRQCVNRNARFCALGDVDDFDKGDDNDGNNDDDDDE